MLTTEIKTDWFIDEMIEMVVAGENDNLITCIGLNKNELLIITGIVRGCCWLPNTWKILEEAESRGYEIEDQTSKTVLFKKVQHIIK